MMPDTATIRFHSSSSFACILLLCGMLWLHAIAEPLHAQESDKVEPAAPIVQESASQEPAPQDVNRLDELNDRARGEALSEKEQSVLRGILWYLPNRLIDLFDIFRLDLGIGGSGGAVIRATRYGQFGARFVGPASARIGLRGREIPFFLERHSEYGFGSEFQQTPNRRVTPYEVGIGVDAVVGGYFGLSFDELFDFFAGFLLFDPKGDDLVR